MKQIQELLEASSEELPDIYCDMDQVLCNFMKGADEAVGSSFIHAGTTSFTLDNDYKDFHFSSNGKYLYLLGNQTKLIYQYELSTPWDISTASLDKKMHFGYNTGNALYDKSMFMHPDGMTMWIYSIQNASEVNVVSAGSYKPVGTRTHLYPNHPDEYFLHNNASVRIHKIIR